MKPKAITYDCAGTLVNVKWDSAGLAIESAEECGISLDPGDARARYERMLQGRWITYRQINATRDEQACEAWWFELTEDWLKDLGLPTKRTQDILARAFTKLYGPNSQVFTLFEDTLPGIELAKSHGYRIAVLSNWDYSLMKVLRSLDLADHFEAIVISLLEGVEKPDARLFEIASQKLGVPLSEMVHVGDCPNDDIIGSRNAGCRGILIDRSQPKPTDGCITSLTQVVQVIDAAQ
jgi:putative hydrolase of the HAD superfamily